jgi:thiosulfate dehydrogenase [quinone] large subunit
MSSAPSFTLKSAQRTSKGCSGFFERPRKRNASQIAALETEMDIGMQMTERSQTLIDRQIAYALLRVTLGINIALHGIARLAAGQGIFAAHLMKQFADAPLPAVLVHTFAYALPWAESAIGLLILLGAATRLALIAGALLMAVLTFGVALVQDWPVAGLQLTYALVFSLLLAFAAHNRWSVDGFIARRSR